VVPQIVRARADVADLRDPVWRELVLHAQVPLENAGNDAFWARRLDRTVDAGRAAYGERARESTRDQLRCGREGAHVEVCSVEAELGWIEPEVIEDVGFGGVEHAECAANNGVAGDRVGEAETRSPIALVELHTGVRNTTRAIRGGDDGLVQIEVADISAGWRCDLITQAKIDGQLLADTEIVLEEFRKIPVTRRVEAREEVLFVLDGNSKQSIRNGVAAV